MPKVKSKFFLNLLLLIMMSLVSIFIVLICNLLFTPAPIKARIFHGLLYGFLWGIPYSVAFVFVSSSFFPKYLKHTVFIAIFTWLLFTVYIFQPPSPNKLLRKTLTSSIPGSVKNLKANANLDFFDHLNIISFDISDEDLSKLLRENKFIPVQYINYENFVLKYVDNNTNVTFPLSWTTPPLWFELHKWQNPSMFKTSIAKEHQLLLIHNNNGKVYIIDYKW